LQVAKPGFVPKAKSHTTFHANRAKNAASSLAIPKKK
jgi:hypothetical protein